MHEQLDGIAMGSIYLDKGESVTYLEAQIQRMAEYNPICYFLDIICAPTQLDEVALYVDDFYELTRQIIPNLPDDKKFIGITCNDKIRPAASALVVSNVHSHPMLLDVNPERKSR